MSYTNLRLRNVHGPLPCLSNKVPNRNPTSSITKCTQSLMSLSPLKLDHHLGSADHDTLGLPPSCPSLLGESHKRINDRSIFKPMDHPFNSQRTSKMKTTGKKLKRKPLKGIARRAGRRRHHQKAKNNRKRDNHFKGASFHKDGTVKAVALSNLIHSTESNNHLDIDQQESLKSISSLPPTTSMPDGLSGGGPVVPVALKTAIDENSVEECRASLDTWFGQGGRMKEAVSQSLLYSAVLNKSFECASLLIENGADIYGKDNNGKSGADAWQELFDEAHGRNDKAKMVELLSLGADEEAGKAIKAIVYEDLKTLEAIRTKWEQQGKNIREFRINVWFNTLPGVADMLESPRYMTALLRDWTAYKSIPSN